MNQLEETFCQVMIEWNQLFNQANCEPIDAVDMLDTNKALNAHAAALVAAKRDQVKKLRTPVAGAETKLHQAR